MTESISYEMASEGVMGSVQPSRAHLGDIEFGWAMLQQIVEMEIGPAMAVRERDVIAVEVTEGTASMIRRAGKLCRRRGWVLLKTAPRDDAGGQEAAVTVETIGQLAAAGGGCLALGAGRVPMLDRPAVLEAAARAKIAVVGVGAEGSGVRGQGSG